MKKHVQDSYFLTAFNACLTIDSWIAILWLCIYPLIKLFPVFSRDYLVITICFVGFAVILDLLIILVTIIMEYVESTMYKKKPKNRNY